MSDFNVSRNLLRILVAGSVDDGKSTMLGRLLYESNGVFEDQLDSVRKASLRKNSPLDLSLITDGLRAEREQSITIDVAYRYFSTARRKFIIADTPGHEQYTRNMVTGASNSDVAILLVDVRKGILEQTVRHACIIWLLGIRQVILAINKLDLVDFDHTRFDEVRDSFARTAATMDGLQAHCIPISALQGDNIVQKSERTPWYTGPSLLKLLETIPAGADSVRSRFRFPVQLVLRPDQDFRGYAGQIVSGTVRVGDQVLALPSGRPARVNEIHIGDRMLAKASAPQSVTLCLDQHIDLGRGDMLADPVHSPIACSRFTAELIWVSQRPTRPFTPYLMKHASQVACCSIITLVNKFDPSSQSRTRAASLDFNDIGLVELETHKPVLFEPYTENRPLGNFILIDPETNETAAAGIFRHATTASAAAWKIPGQALYPAGGTRGLVVWFTGLSGAGKTTICTQVGTELLARGFRVEILDGDVVRKQLNSDLGFSKQDRDDNVRRLGFVAQLLARNGVTVLVSAISPYRNVRQEVRSSCSNFLEVYVKASLGACEARDPKGLYKRARAGEIPLFTGINDPYEPPLYPDVECETELDSVKACMDKVIHSVMASLSTPPAEKALAKHDAFAAGFISSSV